MWLISRIKRLLYKIVRSFIILLSIVFIDIPLYLLMLIFPPLRRKIESLRQSGESSQPSHHPETRTVIPPKQPEVIVLPDEVFSSNPQRYRAYLHLINILMNYDISAVAQIVDRNQELMDEGLVKMMLEVAKAHAKTGHQNTANELYFLAGCLFLRLLLQELSQQFFTTMLEKTDVGSNRLIGCVWESMSKNSVERLDESSLKIRKKVLSMLENNLEILDERLVSLVSEWAKIELAVEEKLSFALFNKAAAVHSLSDLMVEFAKGDQSINIEIAIAGYEAIANVFTAEVFPNDKKIWARLQNKLGFAYLRRIKGNRFDNFEKAIRYYEPVLQVPNPYGFLSQELAECHFNLGACYFRREKGDKAENIESAIGHYEDDLIIRRAAPDNLAESQKNLAALYTQRIKGNKADNLQKALEYGNLALTEYTREKYPSDWAHLQIALGNIYLEPIMKEEADNIEKSIEHHQEALKVFTYQDFPFEWASCQHNLGEAYRYRLLEEKAENIEIAINYYKNALKEYKLKKHSLSDVEFARTKNCLGEAYRERIRGDQVENLEIAITHYLEALNKYNRQDFPWDWASVNNNLGNAYFFRSREARKEYIRQSQKLSQDWILLNEDLAIERILSNLNEGIKHYQNALEIWTKEAYPWGFALVKMNLGNAYRERLTNQAEALEKAIEAHQDALSVYNSNNFPYDWARVQIGLGTAYCERIHGNKADNLEKGIKALQDALYVCTRQDFLYEWAQTQNNLGYAYSIRIKGNKAENIKQGIECYQNVLDNLTPESNPSLIYISAFNLGNLHFSKENWQEATLAYNIAIEAAETYRSEALIDDRKEEIISDAIKIYHRIVHSYLNLYHQQENNPQHLKTALEYIERSKARNLVELMTQKNLQPQGVDQTKINTLNELRQKVFNEKKRLEIEARKKDNEDNQTRTIDMSPYVRDYNKLKEAQQRLDDFIEQEITPIDPTVKLTQKVEPIPFKDIQGLIDEQTAILEWYITEDKILAFIVSSEGLITPNLPATGDNNAGVKVWQSTAEDLQNLLNWKDEYLNLYEQNKHEWIKTLDSRLNNLSEILHLDRILDLVPESCNQLILIPHYFLHIFPLHTLPLKNGKSLYQCFSQGVGYAPSCQLLKLVQERKSQRQEEFNHLFAIHSPTRPDREAVLGSNLEIARISQHFDLQNSIILAGCQASETMLEQRQEKLKSTHCLHFACHGKFNSKSPLDSALLLADPEGNLGESANLTLAEIFEKLDLQKCRLVTLSACESGMIDPTVISDEYIGIPSGFLFARSLSVVSTLWTVDPLATTLFMAKFYQNLQRNQGSVIIAANKAQTWLRNFTSKKLARIKDSQKFQQLLEEVFENQKRDRNKFKDLLEAAVKRQPYPFANPYYWTAFIATGI